jgi:hypothetical protein
MQAPSKPAENAPRPLPPTAAGADPGRPRLWPWLLAPPLIVAAAVLWLWLGAEGGFSDAGQYTLR